MFGVVSHQTTDGHLAGDKTTLPRPLTVRLQNWAGPWHRTKDSWWSNFFLIYFSLHPLCVPPPPAPFVFLVTKAGREKRRKKKFQSEQKTGSKISQRTFKQMCGLDLGDFVFVYCLFWISTLCPQIKLQGKGKPGRRLLMSVQLLNTVKGTLMKD